MLVTATTDRPCETIDPQFCYTSDYVWRILTYLFLFCHYFCTGEDPVWSKRLFYDLNIYILILLITSVRSLVGPVNRDILYIPKNKYIYDILTI